MVWTKFRIIISCFLSYKRCCHHNLVDKETKVQTIKGQFDGGFTFFPGTYVNSGLGGEQLEQCFSTFSTLTLLQFSKESKLGLVIIIITISVLWLGHSFKEYIL